MATSFNNNVTGQVSSVGLRASLPKTKPVQNTLPSKYVATPTRSNQNQPLPLASFRPTADNPNPFRVTSSPSVGGQRPANGTPVANAATTQTPYTSTPSPSVVGNNPRQMTPQEAAGGQAGIQAYNTRIAGLTSSASAPEAPRNTTTAQTPAPKSGGLYGELIDTLKSRSLRPSGEYQSAVKQAERYNRALQTSRTNQANSLAQNFSNPIPIEFQQGRGQVLTNQYLAQQGALASAFQGATNLVGAANTQQQTQQAGLLGAAGLAQPVQVPYSNQYISPVSGETIGGQGGAVGGSLQGAVTNIAQKVQNGTMGYDQGLAALGAYGQAGVNALQQALGPNFDVVASNAGAGARATSIGQTGSIGGQLTKAAQSANQALDTLSAAYAQLGPTTGASGVPFIDSLTQNFALQTGIGREAVSGYVGALNEARAQLRAVLGSAGVNDLAAGGIVDSLLPNNMTPGEIPQKIEAAKVYIQNRVDAFTSSNAGALTPQAGGGGLYDF